MDTTILLCTGVAEVFLALGYGLAKWEQFLAEGRAMFLGFCAAMRAGR